MNPLLDLRAVANQLSVSIYTVRAWIREGQIRPVRLGRRVLVEPEEVQRFISDAKSKHKGNTPVM